MSRRSGSFGKLFHEWRMPEDGRQCLHPVSCSASSYSKLHIVSCHAIPSCWFYLSVVEVWFNMGVTEKGQFVRVAKPEKSEPQCKQFGLATPPESDPFHLVSGHHTRLSQKLRSKCVRMLGFPGKWSFCKLPALMFPITISLIGLETFRNHSAFAGTVRNPCWAKTLKLGFVIKTGGGHVMASQPEQSSRTGSSSMSESWHCRVYFNIKFGLSKSGGCPKII